MEEVSLQLFDPVKQSREPQHPKKSHSQKDINKSVADSLKNLFPEQQYEDKLIKKTEEILGETAKEFSHEELRNAVVEMQYLIDSWLDDFERSTFDGMTLRELLHENGEL